MNIKIFQILFYMLRLFYKTCNVTARIPLAQALIESAAWTSPLYKSTNNMFGMMHPQARQTTSLGPNTRGFATYRSPLDSIRDYFKYLEAIGLYNDGALEQRLASGKYAADPNYLKKVNAKIAEYESQMISPTSFNAGAAAAAVAAVVGGSVISKAVK